MSPDYDAEAARKHIDPETGTWCYWLDPPKCPRLYPATVEALRLLAEAPPGGKGLDTVELKDTIRLAADPPLAYKTADHVLFQLQKFGALTRKGGGRYWYATITDKGRSLLGTI